MATELNRGQPLFIADLRKMCHAWGKYRNVISALITAAAPAQATAIIAAVDLLASICPILEAANPVAAP